MATNDKISSNSIEFLYYGEMKPRFPSLDHMRTFAIAAQHMSFKQAAAELNVTAGAIGQRIQRLEQQLGVELFKRQTRAITLTPKGQLLLTHVNQALANIESGLEEIRERNEHSTLRLYTTPVFAERWLLNRLSRFRALHTNIRVQLIASAEVVTLQNSSPELAIRYGNGVYENCSSSKLLDDVYLPVCSPQLGLEIAENMRQEKDTVVTLIHCDWATKTDWSPSWQQWLKKFESQLQPRSNDLSFSHESLCIQAAITGQGIALVHRHHVLQELQSGELVNPFNSNCVLIPKFKYFLVEPDAKPFTDVTELFRSWLGSELVSEAQT